MKYDAVGHRLNLMKKKTGRIIVDIRCGLVFHDSDRLSAAKHVNWLVDQEIERRCT